MEAQLRRTATKSTALFLFRTTIATVAAQTPTLAESHYSLFTSYYSLL